MIPQSNDLNFFSDFYHINQKLWKPQSRYTPDIPQRTLVQAPTNYADFVRTTPPAGQPGPLPNTDVKVTKIYRKAAQSPERKISTGSMTSRIGNGLKIIKNG